MKLYHKYISLRRNARQERGGSFISKITPTKSGIFGVIFLLLIKLPLLFLTRASPQRYVLVIQLHVLYYIKSIHFTDFPSYFFDFGTGNL